MFQLPSEAEWERAARGPEGTRYPWGDAFEDWREGYAAMSGRLERVGSYRKDVNGWGLKDVVGNVHELTGAREGDLIVVRGGSANVSRDEAGVDERLLVAPGQEVGAFIGLRLFAVERSDGAERSD